MGSSNAGEAKASSPLRPLNSDCIPSATPAREKSRALGGPHAAPEMERRNDLSEESAKSADIPFGATAR